MTSDQLTKLMERLKLDSITPRPSSVTACCPFHNERRPSFGVSIHKVGHPWGCFSCGVKGASVVSLVSKLLMLPKPDAKRYCEQFGVVELPEFLETDPKPKVREFNITDNFKFFLKDAARLNYHGLPEAICRKANIGYDTLGQRYLVPWYSGPQLLGVTSHAPPDSRVTVKMVPLDGFNHKQHIYVPPQPFQTVKSYEDFAVLVEAPADALRLVEYGFPNVFALGGSSMTAAQSTKLRRLTSLPLVCMLDPDFAGKAGTLKIAKMFDERQVFYAKLKDHDPADATDREVESALRGAILLI